MDERSAYFRWPSRGLVCIGLILTAVTSASLVWIGGELHYRNCLQNAELRYPAAYQPGRGNGYGENLWAAGDEPRAHFAFYKRTERSQAISGCSRWP